MRLHVMGENASAQPQSSKTAQSASAGKKRTRAAETQKPEFSEVARALAAKY
jgi:hypothetical protein